MSDCDVVAGSGKHIVLVFDNGIDVVNKNGDIIPPGAYAMEKVHNDLKLSHVPWVSYDAWLEERRYKNGKKYED